MVSSLGLHGLLLGAAFLFLSYELPRPRRVVPVETISLIPGRPGLCGGHRGMAAPADRPKPSSPKTEARKARPPAKPKPVKTAPEEPKFRPETPPPPSLALLRPITPGPSKEVRSAGSPTGAGASAGAAPGSGSGTGVGQGAGSGGGNRGSGTGGGSSLSSYLQQVKRLLEQHKNYPPAARRQHLEGVVVLHFTIAASGKIESARLSRSSGHGVLDLAAQETLKRVSQFPPLPADLGRPQITVEVPLAYRLMTP